MIWKRLFATKSLETLLAEMAGENRLRRVLGPVALTSLGVGAIIGAGIGGLALAGLLSRQGANVRIYEQAKEFQRIGAGIQMSPNAVRVLRALGLEPHGRRRASAPEEAAVAPLMPRSPCRAASRHAGRSRRI